MREGYDALVADGRLVTGSDRPLADLLAELQASAPEDPQEAPPGEALARLRDDER